MPTFPERFIFRDVVVSDHLGAQRWGTEASLYRQVLI